MKRVAALLLGLAVAAPATAQRTAVRAGTIHVVADDVVFEGGATLLIEQGRIVAVGTEVEVPPDARIVDYGPEAVLVPGFVAADSSLVSTRASERTADPNLRAIDDFDFYADQSRALAAGVTSAYLAPAKSRLISGQGAVVKLGGGDSSSRVLSAPATLHGAISAEARRTRAYWEPPIPATSDVGIGVPLEQLPRTTMGAILALRELLQVAASGEDSELYGPRVASTLAAMIEAGLPWRITARETDELLALAAFQQETGLPIVVHGADAAGQVASRLAETGMTVVYETAFAPNRPAVDRGKSDDALRPDYSTPAKLAAAGVPVAIVGNSAGDLRFAAGLASRGGLSEQLALRAVTLTPAEAYGVASRVGSLTPGKDADFCVLNGPPLIPGSSVLATWVDGGEVWSYESTAPTGSSAAVVIEVDELHVGDGRVLRPGAVLVQDGVITELGPSVGRPTGARVVRGAAAMPGIVDSLGHLGLEGSKDVPSPDFSMARIVGPGDRVDRRVARSGVTTVVLTPRKASSAGAPMMAYKPAASSDERQVVEDVVALRVEWSDSNVYESGENVRSLLEKAVEYDAKWREYEAAMEEWNAKPQPTVSEDDADEEDEDEEDEEEQDEDDDEDEEEEDEDSAESPEVTGLWVGAVERAPLTEPASLRLRLLEEDGTVRGNLRCDALSVDLVQVEGWFEEKTLSLRGLGSQGLLRVDAELVLPEKKKSKKKKKKKKDDDEETPERPRFVGKIELPGEEIEIDLELEERGYPIAGRPAFAVEPEQEAEKPPKGMPKEPRVDSKLEPLRRAIAGRATVVVEVDRENEILDCVEAFRKAGIKPVLFGARDAHYVTGEIAEHVAGVLPNQPLVSYDPRKGANAMRNRYAELQAAGIPVGFASLAEEGAVDLPLMAAFAVSQGMSPAGALRALTGDAASMFSIADRVGLLEAGRDGDVVVLDGDPTDLRSSIEHVFVNGVEIQ